MGIFEHEDNITTWDSKGVKFSLKDSNITYFPFGNLINASHGKAEYDWSNKKDGRLYFYTTESVLDELPYHIASIVLFNLDLFIIKKEG